MWANNSDWANVTSFIPLVCSGQLCLNNSSVQLKKWLLAQEQAIVTTATSLLWKASYLVKYSVYLLKK